MNFKKVILSINLENLIYFFISLVALILVLRSGPILFPDSEGYLQMALFRSCGYPLFIAFHKYVFGENYISALILTQFLATISSILFLVNVIRQSVNLNKWFAIILFITLLLPVFAGIRTANLILSESIAYPLYLFVVGNVIFGIIHKQNKNFYFSFILTYILILVRGQFLFLIPILFFAVLLTADNLIFNKKHLILIVFIITIPILAVLTDVVFHKLRHNQAVTTPWTGIQIVTIPFFVSDKNDYLTLEHKNQQEYFKYIFNKLEKKKLVQSKIPKNVDTKDFFYNNYCNICNFTINDDGLKFFDSKLSIDEKMILNDRMTSSITFTLFKNNFIKWVSIYKSNITKGFGEVKDLFLFLILLCLGFFNLYHKNQFISKFIILLSFLTIGNIALVAIAESVIERYTFYNNWITITIVLILFQNYFQKKTNE